MLYNGLIGELLVIEEFCRYGTIRDYLMAKRDYFVNELNYITTGASQNIEQSTSLCSVDSDRCVAQCKFQLNQFKFTCFNVN